MYPAIWLLFFTGGGARGIPAERPCFTQTQERYTLTVLRHANPTMEMAIERPTVVLTELGCED